MDNKINEILNSLHKYGANKFFCLIETKEKNEITIESNKLMLSQTDNKVCTNIYAKFGTRKVIGVYGEIEENNIDSVCYKLYSDSKSIPASICDDLFTAKIEPIEFSSICIEPENDELLVFINDFVEKVNSLYPEIILDMSASFDTSIMNMKNSENINHNICVSKYDFFISFAANKDLEVSPMIMKNYVAYNLHQPLYTFSGLEEALQNSIEHINSQPLSTYPIEHYVFAPDVVSELVSNFCDIFLTDENILNGTNPLINKIGEKIVSDLITIVDIPEEVKLVFFSEEGFYLKNTVYIESGVLKSFALSQLACSGTGLSHSNSDLSFAVIKPGFQDKASMIQNIDKGVIVNSFDGYFISESGDFAGKASICFYVENGKVMKAVKDTLISGNILDLFNNVKAISKDTLSIGPVQQPWIHVVGLN